ncbi:mechanosensitive ion channel domain-containing protein [Prosthecochloris sp.]|uniref:mechanosensitive ion channel domain-containing protein n=1 Tax=Prosthecochloris sp. TaxID=290513 RepID=UPI0025E6D8E2|nr:mechanosensitive ion channel domain-containing protein [Prosthecochloris sp.]
MKTIFDTEISINIVATVIAFIIYAVLQIATAKSLKRYGQELRFPDQRLLYIKKFFKVFYVTTLLTSIVLIWGIDLQAALVILSSLFAVVGVGLFANWSILSNITASFIIFFTAPYKIGDTIRIVEGENGTEGRIEDIKMFYLKIRNSNGQIISYPNNLVMQKPTIIVASE